jgi:hypothetical protein
MRSRAVPDTVQHWLFQAARVYSRNIRYDLEEGGAVKWSAPRDLMPGDLALLYEMGKRDQPGDPYGRKQIGWLLRACSDVRPDRKWVHAADFEGFPLTHPLALADARGVRGFPASLQGISHRKLPERDWDRLMSRVERQNEGLIARLDREPDALFRDLRDDEAGWDDLEFPEGHPAWRRERWLQDAVTDLIEAEGWAAHPDPRTSRFGKPSEQGYYLSDRHWFVDDLLLLDDRHILVVEYELQALGDPEHGVQQACDYRAALASRLRGSSVDALVIAQDFSQSELALAKREGVECMIAQLDDDEAATLTDAGVPGPASSARDTRARRRRGRRPV